MKDNEKRCFTLDSIIGDPLVISTDKTTRIYGLNIKGREIDISAYSESESMKGCFHKVEVQYLYSSMYIVNGSCTCESFQYYGMPCKHMLKVRNVYIKNREKLKKY